MTLSPRSQEINKLIRQIAHHFAEHQEPPKTNSEFYKIGRALGKGAFGKVNLGMHKLCRKLLAVKSINKERMQHERQRQKVMQEVTIIKRMRHENVVKLYETYESDKYIIFVIELCAGGDLLNYVRKR